MSHPNALTITPFYEDDEMPDIYEMQCPVKSRFEHFIDCEREMNRNELAAHIAFYHPDYESDPEPFFEAERVKRFA